MRAALSCNKGVTAETKDAGAQLRRGERGSVLNCVNHSHNGYNTEFNGALTVTHQP